MGCKPGEKNSPSRGNLCCQWYICIFLTETEMICCRYSPKLTALVFALYYDRTKTSQALQHRPGAHSIIVVGGQLHEM